jgi:hypothetical protein
MEFLETIENVEREAASVQHLFGGEGNRIRSRERDPKYMNLLGEAANLVADVVEGRRGMHVLREAMSTSDFPTLFADILDRQLLANYRETDPVWQNYCRRSTVPDFRLVSRTAIDGAEGALDDVAELEEYPEGKLDESRDQYKVKKTGRRLDLSWEALINDDLDAFMRNPERLARAARRTEDRFATSLHVDSTGPHASLYDVTNTLTGNPTLSINSLQAAMTLLSTFRDNDNEPIFIEMVELVVPPALEIVAQNILNAIVIRMKENGGSANSELEAKNWMAGRFRLSVNPYIPVIANSANGNTSWFLFANPDSGRPALEVGKLRGYEDPALYEKVPDARRVGGGEVMESFDTDSRAWRVRHVIGGTRLTTTGGKKATVASDGSAT